MQKYLSYTSAAKLVRNQVTGELGISYRLVQRYVYDGRLGRYEKPNYYITLEDIEKFNATPRPRGYPKGKPREVKTPDIVPS